MDGLEKNNKAMFSISMSEQGKTVYSRSIGYCDWNNKLKANETTKYHIGSITKMFTAVMILQLVEEKKLDLNTKLSTYYPSLPKADQITIKQLLNHSSGMHNFTNDSNYASMMEHPKTEKELLDYFSKLTPDFEPGEGHEYSNTAYVVLSFIIEKVTGTTYSKALHERVCRKVGLKNTMVGGPIHTSDNVAQSYSRESDDWKKETETDMSIPRGAGAIISTPNDLNQFITALFSNQLLKKETLDEMTTIHDGNGLGIFQFPFGANKAYGHTGGIDGFHSMLGYFPHDGKSIAVICNGLDYNLNNIMIGALSIWYNLPYAIPNMEKVALPFSDIQKLCGHYKEKTSGFGIKIFEKEKNLFAQGDGQGDFPLEMSNNLECHNDQAGVRMVFRKNDQGAISSFTLFQGGMELVFERSEP